MISGENSARRNNPTKAIKAYTQSGTYATSASVQLLASDVGNNYYIHYSNLPLTSDTTIIFPTASSVYAAYKDFAQPLFMIIQNNSVSDIKTFVANGNTLTGALFNETTPIGASAWAIITVTILSPTSVQYDCATGKYTDQ